ncbi:hypothetical protein CEUSTIGMA_g9081.t1 [Chlamydomonas eustigma]|uniref:Uncharacterized protein n=1 Tax=Chlamydomonas eustigma TaxID=1157962 RepID=A0A250XF23_9CHLO|nr:hypothetical protein CEUSTIGMA_g9081.t1 [Chlamydomonas eustigma]|eukprot:GAX81653.1 hypothetical protein CEUSTIGMA_g9081.t1 [Chlamydomonas eustigma]
MKKVKLDFDVTDINEVDVGNLAELKAGDIVFLQPGPTDVAQQENTILTSFEKSISIVTTAGSHISTLSKDTVHKLPPVHTLGEYEVRVRSIKKGPIDGSIKSILFRFQERTLCKEKSSLYHTAREDDAHTMPDPASFQLSRSQLQQLAACQGVRLTLMDERLQSLLTEIDSSGNPEAALESALSKDPAFQAFANQMLSSLQATLQ